VEIENLKLEIEFETFLTLTKTLATDTCLMVL